MSDTSALPMVAVLIPTDVRSQVLAPEAERQLAGMANVVSPAGPKPRADELAEILDGAVACLTGWGTPPLTDDLLRGLPNLELVAHTAGSIRRLVPEAAMSRGIRVSHAANVIADAVAEQVVLGALMCLRPLPGIDRAMKSGGEWLELRERYPGRLLGERTVGVVGAGYVGRIVIGLFRAFGCRVLVADPFLTGEQAADLGAELVDLGALVERSEILSLHAPVLPETIGMIGAAELARLRDGAVFINAARAALVDEDALLRELRSGRITGVLDVFGEEPLPAGSPFRTLPNVVLSPHSAGHTVDTHYRQGQAMVDEVERYLRGQPLRHEVTPKMLAVMA